MPSVKQIGKNLMIFGKNEMIYIPTTIPPDIANDAPFDSNRTDVKVNKDATNTPNNHQQNTAKNKLLTAESSHNNIVPTKVVAK